MVLDWRFFFYCSILLTLRMTLLLLFLRLFVPLLYFYFENENKIQFTLLNIWYHNSNVRALFFGYYTVLLCVRFFSIHLSLLFRVCRSVAPAKCWHCLAMPWIELRLWVVHICAPVWKKAGVWRLLLHIFSMHLMYSNTGDEHNDKRIIHVRRWRRHEKKEEEKMKIKIALRSEHGKEYNWSCTEDIAISDCTNIFATLPFRLSRFVAVHNRLYFYYCCPCTHDFSFSLLLLLFAVCDNFLFALVYERASEGKREHTYIYVCRIWTRAFKRDNERADARATQIKKINHLSISFFYLHQQQNMYKHI